MLFCNKGLPAGTYCNIIDSCATNINVGADGNARIQINNYEEPIVAICVGCTADSGPTSPPCTGNNCEGISHCVYF